jgi:uncharacterized protein (UPF0371 family)
MAYEAATADIADFNLIDPFHVDAYGSVAINYNRDVEIFPVLKRILERITGKPSVYKSPTDMGVNRVGFAITDDEAVRQAAKQEIIRRYFRYSCEYAMGFASEETVQRVELLMKELNVDLSMREVVQPARAAADYARSMNNGNEGVFCGASLALPEGGIVTGKNSALMHATSALILNAVKRLGGIPDQIHLLSPSIIDSVARLKETTMGKKAASLDLDEALIALSISAATNPTAQLAVEQLRRLSGCEVHLTHIPTPGDEAGLKRLGVNLTSDPRFSTRDLFQP